MTLLAVGIAAIVGITVGTLSQMTAVSEVDPRSSNAPTSVAPLATPMLSPSPSPTATPVPTPMPTVGNQVWRYTIATGDSLSGLAIRFGTTEEHLLTLNPEYAENPDLVQVGSQIIMPCTPIAAAEGRC